MNRVIVHFGFTGTERGMTGLQSLALVNLFHEHRYVIRNKSAHAIIYLHHGVCIGADAEAHGIAREADMRRWLHPPVDVSRLARVKLLEDDRCELALPYLERNHKIVDACTTLFAAPRELHEIVRSGTWATIRYARKKKRRIIIVWPNGNVSEE